ncbi:hypothetical protein [Kitasatospora sp. GP82]|uniref:hypothetical protein n=1 Tax=Kitasatospora sp. GP82 TaxID=3035089 RepID=UPI00247362FE|nr:hypothetical protein [Kitasatospora sp. GP82]MDH6128803.1 hypothetical protein [Kitasatospora sp. GP82]
MRAERPTKSGGLGRSPGERELLDELRGRTAHEDRPGLMPLGGLSTYEGALAVDLGSPFLGRPLRTSRDLLRRADPWGIQPDDTVRALNTDKPAALGFLAALGQAGLLSGPDSEDEPQSEYEHDYRTWKLTPRGRVLAYASGRRPSTRRAADALVAKVLKAAAAINENPDEHLWWVKSIRAVGHYVDPSREQLLHVDLAVLLQPRLADPREQAKAEKRLHDDALDRGFTDRVLDMHGYGHWRTRLALAGRSKAVRLFTHPDGVEGRVLFLETRDLTVKVAPTPAYEAPADPAPATGCSWCRRQLPSTRVAARGESFERSPIALCDTCLSLGRSETSGFVGYLSLYGAVRQSLDALTAEPYHPAGCALCGYDRGAAQREWWPKRGREEQAPVTLRLCDVCPGLLELVDRPDREAWWRSRHEAACLTGFYARLRDAARVPLPRNESQAKPRKLPRLTEVHRQLLDDIRGAGALSAVDLARRNDFRNHQDSKWWAVRIGHLLQHGLVATVADGDLWTGGVRIVQDDERALRRELLALYVPGPVWDGTAVTEPEPPAGWTARWAELEALRAEYDRQVLAPQALPIA